MTRVSVAVDDLERGDLPALSVKTGRPCANPVAIVLRPEQRPWWPSGPKVAAVLPIEPERVRARRRFARVSWALLIIGVAGVLAGLTGAGGVGQLVAILGAFAYIATVAVGEWRWVGAKPGERAGEVGLTRVHPAFARAVDEQYGRRAPS
jgi:hypothetical protein